MFLYLGFILSHLVFCKAMQLDGFTFLLCQAEAKYVISEDFFIYIYLYLFKSVLLFLTELKPEKVAFVEVNPYFDN